jgi:hypothetical protein
VSLPPAASGARALGRRDFLKMSALAGAAAAGSVVPARAASAPATSAATDPSAPGRAFGAPYQGRQLDRVAFPLGGIGSGMICIEGAGSLSHASLRHHPDVFNEPCAFAAISIAGPQRLARVLEGPVPTWKFFGSPGTARGGEGKPYGLPRLATATFRARFPFAEIDFTDEQLPLGVRLVAWSPFTPPDADDSSLPVAALEYEFVNHTGAPVEAVFSFHAADFFTASDKSAREVRRVPGGFVLRAVPPADAPWLEASFAACVDEPDARVDAAWFRGRFRDWLPMVWNHVESGACPDQPPHATGAPSRGASLYVPLRLASRARRTITLRLGWHAPRSKLRTDRIHVLAPPAPYEESGCYQPWYAQRYRDIDAVLADWRQRYGELRFASERFAECLHDTTLPPEVLEAVTANLAILKSPTLLREQAGRLWAWEGCKDDSGSCAGSCTHVWNYAQAIAHLFPSLERSLRESEFGSSQDEHGRQNFRTSLPIRPPEEATVAAADGQLGGIMKFYRDWRISGDADWLRRWWPRVRQSLDYCIATWDPEGKGLVEEPHHNTYDIELWGPDSMATTIYLGALSAAIEIARALGEDAARYTQLLAAGREKLRTVLFNGEYLHQRVEWKNLRAKNPAEAAHGQVTVSPEWRALVEQSGPLHQYGPGCLADGVIGAWFASVCGVGDVADANLITSHLRAVYRHNLRRDLSDHANPQRPTYAVGREGGLLLCTWPRGDKPPLAFPYSDEVWTGIEYQVASHLIMTGQVAEGLDVVRLCRARYDGRVRNPFNEYECGHWYGRALSSYALLQAMSGARYDAVTQVLHLQPPCTGDFRAFLSTATGFGSVGVRDGRPFLDVRAGRIPLREIAYTPAAGGPRFSSLSS